MDPRDRIIISSEDLRSARAPHAPPLQFGASAERGASGWLIAMLALSVLLPPLLCFESLILLIVTRSWAPTMRLRVLQAIAWSLLASCILTLLAVLVLIATNSEGRQLETSSATLKHQASLDLGLPNEVSPANMNPADLAERYGNSVAIVGTPGTKSRIDAGLSPLQGFGSATVLSSTKDGTLLATNRHVVEGIFGTGTTSLSKIVEVIFKIGVSRRGEVAAIHDTLDIALVWIPVPVTALPWEQALLPIDAVRVGSEVTTFGHPQGLYFTMGNGLVSRKQAGVIQISAPTAPGSSGGPVYDARGNLLAIVTAMFDKRLDPNSENLNFSLSVNALSERDGWQIQPEHAAAILAYFQRTKTPNAPPTSVQPNP